MQKKCIPKRSVVVGGRVSDGHHHPRFDASIPQLILGKHYL
jgi:hypothetical protein